MRQRLSVRRLLYLIGAILLGPSSVVWADGNVGIGTTTPDTSAILELRSIRQGLLIPRMTTAQRDAIVLPAKSLLIFNTTTNRFEFNDGTPTTPNWVPFAIGTGTFWSLQGNAGINPPQHFLGTTDAQPLIIKTSGQERLIITPSENVGIGTSTPLALLLVGNASQFQVNNGEPWLPLISTISANSTVVTRIKASDESVSNSTVLQDDDHLFATLGANQVWEIEGMLDFSSLSATPGVTFGMAVPTGATFKLSFHCNDGSATSFRAGVLNGGSTSINIPAGSSTVVFVRGIVVMGSNSGTVRLQWAQNTADASPTIARTNSYLKFTRIQ